MSKSLETAYWSSFLNEHSFHSPLIGVMGLVLSFTFPVHSSIPPGEGEWVPVWCWAAAGVKPQQQALPQRNLRRPDHGRCSVVFWTLQGFVQCHFENVIWWKLLSCALSCNSLHKHWNAFGWQPVTSTGIVLKLLFFRENTKIFFLCILCCEIMWSC